MPAATPVGYGYATEATWSESGRGWTMVGLLLGRYSITTSTPAAGALRPLRALNAPDLDEDEDGAN
ncbi:MULTISPECIES: hypothetical protein [Streptomyces]|uniref:Uncharacterized protein n=1 Tax=Streptomyces galilaeus TaxID=33899 RepID=A0ABW9IWC3_STRGJ